MPEKRREWQDLVTTIALALPPLQLRVEGTDGSVASGRADLVVSAEWSGARKRFAAEYLAVGTPKNLAGAIEQAKSIAAQADEMLPMVVAPFLSTEALTALERAGVSGVDLSGNGVVVIPGHWLVWRTGEKNRYPASAPIKAVYRGTSSLVGRVFLSRPEFPRFGAIQEEIEARGGSISASTVSKVLGVLEEDLIVERAASGIIRLLSPERLLDRLVAGYTFAPVRSLRGSLTDPNDRPRQFRERAEAAGARLMVREERKYVPAPDGDDVVTYYTNSIVRALAGTAFDEEPRYGYTQLIETHRLEVFFDAREEQGMAYASPLQIYLELATGGKREQEVAQPLREDLLSFRLG